MTDATVSPLIGAQITLLTVTDIETSWTHAFTSKAAAEEFLHYYATTHWAEDMEGFDMPDNPQDIIDAFFNSDQDHEVRYALTTTRITA